MAENLKLIRSENFILKLELERQLKEFETNFYNMSAEEKYENTPRYFDYKQVTNSVNNDIDIDDTVVTKLINSNYDILELSHKLLAMMRNWCKKPDVASVLTQIADY